MRRKDTRARTRLDTQDRLIAACREVIVTDGVDNSSVEAICQRAGFTRGAFYSNFSTKEELFAALADEEYTRLTTIFTTLCTRWKHRGSAVAPTARESEQIAAIRHFLFEAIDAIGFDPSLYLVHTELTTRAVRDPAWGVDLGGVNTTFINAMAEVLQTVIRAAGRELTSPVRPLVHAAIAIILRAAAIHAWRSAARTHSDRLAAGRNAREAALGLALPSTTRAAEATAEGEGAGAGEEAGAAGSLSRDILETLVLMLCAASAPRRRR